MSKSGLVNLNEAILHKIISYVSHATELNDKMEQILLQVQELLPYIKCAIDEIEVSPEESKKAEHLYRNGTGTARRKAEKFLKGKGLL